MSRVRRVTWVRASRRFIFNKPARWQRPKRKGSPQPASPPSGVRSLVETPPLDEASGFFSIPLREALHTQLDLPSGRRCARSWTIGGLAAPEVPRYIPFARRR